MKYNFNKVPRKFEVGINTKLQISDFGSVNLEADEQITFITEGGNEYDVARKSWGFYATPSINGRLIKNRFRVAHVVNTKTSMQFILLVEYGKEDDFFNYCNGESMIVLKWLS